MRNLPFLLFFHLSLKYLLTTGLFGVRSLTSRDDPEQLTNANTNSHNNSDADLAHRRRLRDRDTYVPPSDKYYEWRGRRVTNTSTSQVPTAINLLLGRVATPGNISIASLEYLNRSIDALQQQLGGYNTESRAFKQDGYFLNKHRDAVNSYGYRLHARKISQHDKNSLEETLHYESADVDEQGINTMFDAIVLTGVDAMDVAFLEKWRPVLEHVHLIIIQRGSAARQISIPDWADYELYTQNRVRKVFGSDKMWLFGMNTDTWAAANVGFLVADREYVFIVDPDMEPISFAAGTTTGSPTSTTTGTASTGDGEVHQLLRSHALNMRKPSLPYYYTAMDPFQPSTADSGTTDFARGFPYSLRDGVKTAITIGAVAQSADYDTLTQLLRPTTLSTPAAAAATATANAATGATNRVQDIVTTVPNRSLFSLSLRNTAFNRQLIGPAFCLFGGLQISDDFFISSNFEVIAGWVLKVLCDHLGLGIKHIQYPVMLRASNTAATFNENQFFNTLKEDLTWVNMHEQVLRFFMNVRLSDRTANDVSAAVRELGDEIRAGLGDVHPAFNRLYQLLHEFSHLWSQRNAFNLQLVPVATRSSIAPLPSSPHPCAMFTIAHNESSMLDIWVRHYGRHFPNATWILNHHSGSDEEANKLKANRGLMEQYGVRSIELYGDKAGFPMGFFTHTAFLMQQRLLRSGYKCVLLSDVDELIVPDPRYYPNGLQEYISKFANDSEKIHLRANAYIIAHISQPDGNEREHLEPPLNWSESWLKQRHYMYPQPRYCKPLLTKSIIRYRPGFHNVYLPLGVIEMDPQLLLFHLREIDRDECLLREYRKFKLIEHGHQSEIDQAFNIHIVNFNEMNKKGVACQFGKSTYYKKYDGAFDNTGLIRLELIPERFHKVLV